MTAVKPKPDHPWRRGFITRKINEQIKQSIINPKVNNWKVSDWETTSLTVTTGRVVSGEGYTRPDATELLLMNYKPMEQSLFEYGT